MFFKLAIHNVRRSLRDYAIYFLTLTFGVCLFYVFNSMDSQQAMTSLNSNQREIIQLLTSAIGYVSIFISFILGFLVVYSNRFLMKRRKKELGIYMLLGMDKGKISRILIIETLLIGIFSLGIGLAVGIFASQGLSAITAGIFEMDLSSFQFTFSLSAFYKTLLYFGIIFLIVMIFNTISISKYKLITLLQASRKNESFKVRNIWISIIAFIVSIACFAAAYYLVLTRGWESGGMLLTCIILGCVGTLLFFFSLSGILLRVIKTNKKLYYKGLNMFIFRQISSKINTAFISIGLICLMLFVTMVTFSAGISIAHASSQAVKSAAPYDISITKSIYQSDTQTQPTENKKHVKEMLERALVASPDVIVLPEMWNTGYALDELDGLADKEGLESQEFLSQFAREHAVAILGGSVAIERDGKFYNTTYVYNKSGDLINIYSKVHLFGLMAEDQYMSAGAAESIFELDGVIAASVICYDIRFPEWVRTQMAQGAKVLFVVAQWPEPRVQQWEILLKARAVENQAFVVAVNRVGTGPDDVFSGHSMVIDPLGNVVLESKEHEEGILRPILILKR